MDGALLISGLQPTIDLRDSLYVPDGTTNKNGNIGIRHITPGEKGVTAKNIWIASDSQPSGPNAGEGENWSGQGCGAYKQFISQKRTPKPTYDEFVDALDFPALTLTASSYGFMQVMWPLVERYKWNVDDPANPGQTTQSPRYLVDSAEAIALKRGGSMLVGSQEDVDRVWNYWGNGGEPGVFRSTTTFFDSFKDPLRAYTGGGPRSANYGTNIIDIYRFNYPPTAPSQIFP